MKTYWSAMTGSLMTAWRPASVVPSATTAKAYFFCLLTLFTQPCTVTEASGPEVEALSTGGGTGRAKSCAIVGGSRSVD